MSPPAPDHIIQTDASSSLHGRPPTELKENQIIHAHILDKLPNNDLILFFNGNTYYARSNLPLEKGQNIIARIQSMDSGLVLSLIAFFLPRLVPLPGVSFFFAFLGMVSLSLLFTQTGRLLILVISGFVAFLFARIANKRPVYFQNLIQRSFLVMVAVASSLVFLSRMIIR